MMVEICPMSHRQIFPRHLRATAPFFPSMRYPSLIILVLLPSCMVAAAPPEVTSFSPTGVTRGQTAEVTAGGNLGGTWPAQVWSDNPGLTIEALEGRGKLKVTA